MLYTLAIYYIQVFPVFQQKKVFIMSLKYHDLEVESISLNIGHYTVKSLSTAAFGLDGGAMFGTVPKVLWSKTNPSDEQNKILMDCRCLLLVSDDKKILIDTGLGGDFIEKYGPKLGPNFYTHYNISEGDSSGIVRALEKQNLKTTDITDVILTHLHFDHAGGATKAVDSKIVPTFENATYYIQKKNLEVAQKPNLREKASYYSCNFAPLIEHNCLRVLNGPEEIFPNIRLSLTHGHTQGQQTVWIEDRKTSLLYCADLIPTATHVRLPWVMGYDLEPLTLIDEKRSELKEAVDKNSYLFFEHDPYCSLAQVKESENRKDYRLKALFNLSD
jgi:glyoxylase-like metal-dependent hydrolase (beta-lactamase superfamily II)